MESISYFNVFVRQLLLAEICIYSCLDLLLFYLVVNLHTETYQSGAEAGDEDGKTESHFG